MQYVLREGIQDARLEGGRSWEATHRLGKGGQGTVYAAREIAADGKVIEELVDAVRHASSSVVGPNDRRGPRLAEALERFLKSRSPEQHVIKIYSPRPEQTHDDMLQRFDQEAAVLSRLSHPGIVRVVDSGRLASGGLFLVMPLFPRGSLDHCRADFVGRPDECLRATAELLDAVCALHSAGVVHRDIKPGNILVGNLDQLVLADFGLVYDEGAVASATRTNERIGNWQFGPDWGYIDPDSQRSKLVDLYALAKVLWWMASGGEFLPREDFGEPEFDLARRFPQLEDMAMLHQVFASVLVRRPESVKYKSADEMRIHVRSLLDELRNRRSYKGPPPRRCRACQNGWYKRVHDLRSEELEQWKTNVNTDTKKARDTVVVGVDCFRCDTCGHLVWYATHPAPSEDKQPR